MTTNSDAWDIPNDARPVEGDVDFDLNRALDAVVSVRTRIPEDAFTAPILGTERAGHGVVIAEGGLVLTVGYLVTEAADIWLTASGGRSGLQALPAHQVAYDFESGLGLVQALGTLDVAPLPLGRSAALRTGEQVLFAGAGGRRRALLAKVEDIRPFAGYWEYFLKDAIYTGPAHPNWGGAGLINRAGELVGIGSLLVQPEDDDDEDRDSLLDNDEPTWGGVGDEGASLDTGVRAQGNMSIPIDLLPPILDDLQRYGRRRTPSRPWIGAYATDVDGRLVVVGLSEKSPAARAGLATGDVIFAVGDREVTTLAGFLQGMWALGPAGTEIPLTVFRDGQMQSVRVRSVDRADLLKRPSLH